ncbi:hypothetical protein NONO_c62360 [Nocardia nova SH22a]|uniref:Uncharacterized protein n=1 Tax=Nocardia nova SH22a TaxID=1415166 RepID=W5TV07_9NOCA|nr:hypothetical protein NONO_c62360 [Nocardia nova SH22a]
MVTASHKGRMGAEVTVLIETCQLVLFSYSDQLQFPRLINQVALEPLQISEVIKLDVAIEFVSKLFRYTAFIGQ